MNTAPSHRADGPPEFDEIIACYLREVDEGRCPNRIEYLSRHPEMAEQLEAFFAAHDDLERLAAPIRVAVDPVPQQLDDRNCDSPDLRDTRFLEPPHGASLCAPPETERDPNLKPTIDWPAPMPRTLTDGPPVDGSEAIAEIRDFGDYELIEELARGGMGVVFKARQRSLNRTVALKMILGGWFAAPDDVKRFRAEAEAAAALDHPNIVPIYEVGQHSGLHYFSMKLVDGGSLAARIRQQRLEPREAARIVTTLARAVHYAHQRGILHRDLKPANILLDPRGEPHITDFGLAKLLEGDGTLTRTGAIVGTPGYMAPEQATSSNQPLTTAVDVFSLGTILYETLTGRPPFHGDSVMETLQRVRERDPDRPSGVNPRIDRDLETIVLRCLEKDPARRYGSAEAMADDLDRWLAGEPVRARPVGDLARALKWAKRRPAITALSGTLLLLLLAATVGVAVEWRRTLASFKREKLATEATKQQYRRAESLAEANRRNLYAARISLAHQAWSRGDLTRADFLLDSLVPATGQDDIRGLEWYYLHRLCHAEIRAVAPQSGPVRAVAFSPDGQFLATAGNDPVVRIWKAANGQLAHSLSGHGDWVSSLAFSPDGTMIASASKDKTIRLWDTSDGRERKVLTGHKLPVNAIAFSPDGETLASAGAQLASGMGNPFERFVPDPAAGELKLWNLKKGTERDSAIAINAAVLTVAFSPGGETLAAAGADGVIMLVRSDQKPLRLEGHQGPVFSLAFDADGRRLATAGQDGTTRLWEVGTGAQVVVGRHGGPVFAVAFSRDGQQLAAGGYNHAIVVWDAATGQLRSTIKGHASYVWSLAFAPEGRSLASASWDGTIKVWDTSEAVDGVPLSDGTAPTGFSLAFSPDGRSLATGVTNPAIWDVARRSKAVQFDGPPEGDLCLAYSPDGKLLATSGVSGIVILWETSGKNKVREFDALPRKVCSLAFSPDGSTLAVGCADRTLRLWDVTSGTELAQLKGHTSWVRSAAFSPDGRTIATGSFDKTIKLWDMATKRELHTLTGHTAAIDAIAFSPDGRLLASAGEDRTARLWDLESLRERAVLTGHTDTVFDVKFSPDGKTVATASWDASIKLWNVGTHQDLVSLIPTGQQAWCVAFSPDGQTLAGSFGGEVFLWFAPKF